MYLQWKCQIEEDCFFFAKNENKKMCARLISLSLQVLDTTYLSHIKMHNCSQNGQFDSGIWEKSFTDFFIFQVDCQKMEKKLIICNTYQKKYVCFLQDTEWEKNNGKN